MRNTFKKVYKKRKLSLKDECARFQGTLGGTPQIHQVIMSIRNFTNLNVHIQYKLITFNSSTRTWALPNNSASHTFTTRKQQSQQ